MENINSRFKVLSRRATILAGGKLALFSILGGRMYYLQVLQADQYKMMADENRISLRLLSPTRGRILDRFGAELANSRQNYRVELIPEQTAAVEDTLIALARIVPISERNRRRVLREAKRKRSFVPITVAENLDWELFAQVNVHSPDLPGIQPDVGETRFYPHADAFAHTVGYVAAASEDEVGDDPLLQLPGFRVGKDGLERVFDAELRGAAGDNQVEVNAFGRVIRELNRNDGEPGEDLVLTVDAKLQEFAHKRLEGESASAVVLDVHTGDVLALVSTPGFDPNDFNVGLSQEKWQSLLDSPRAPLTNKTVAGQYPPGSAFKMVVALAALEAGVIGADHRVHCRGSTVLGNNEFHCWKKHGTLNLVDAVAQSCDVHFYDIAKRTGIDRISEMAVRMGLGQTLGVGLPGEKPGLIPTRDWKLATYGVPWQQGETLNAGIGQGFVLTTPLQLAVMTARLVNGGFAVTPHLVRALGGTEIGTRESPATLGISQANLALMREAMAKVTSAPRGTAFASRIRDKKFAMAGKTGTAQVLRISKEEWLTGVRKNEDKKWIERDHALFVGYAPVSAPRYAVSVIVEHGGSGSKSAAPIARDILLESQKLDPISRAPYRPGATAGADQQSI